jgi:Ca2+-transporting ATPase
MADWYKKSTSEVISELKSSPANGLEQADANQRLGQYGPNELVDRGGKSPWKILLEQLTGIMTVVLLISAVISFFLRDYEDAIAILAIVVLNTLLGFSQEYRAEQAMAALKKMAVPNVKVRRSGHVQEISARELVPGDMVLLEAGNLIPADGRLVESINLRIQESVLTGESEPIEKITEALQQDNLALGDQRNSAFMGTIITYGRGLLLITETGMRTELGKIAAMLQSVSQEATPMQRRLEQLAKILAAAALVIVAVVFALGLLRGEEIRLMFMTSISMAVAAIPEGLPTVVTIGLALGAQAMLKRKSLIRKLPAVETLGSVTVICSDKTGTLTENRMTVTFLDVANHQIDLKERLQDFSPRLRRAEADPSLANEPAINLLLAGGALCNDAILEASSQGEDEFSSVGDPTEGALVIAAARADLWKEELDRAAPRISELPFDSDRKRMTTVHKIESGSGLAKTMSIDPDFTSSAYLALTKGAVDGMLDNSSRIWVDGSILPFDEAWRERTQAANNRLAQNGMRVLGLAYQLRQSSDTAHSDQPLEKDMVFVGMIGMIDPARPEVKQAVQLALSAGIRPIMITGDHPLTALSIARDLGITRNNQVVTGQELSLMSMEDLSKAVKATSVFARVSPEHKLKIVQALQEQGEVVAMTGDGVNDAPALKKADIGVAMGITGTDVSKESADMVLLDDNFATIVAAVEEGRRIYDNIRKFIKYALSSNTGEIITMLIAPFLGMPLPLLPLQILWVNLVTDGLPGLALTLENAERNTMRRPPYPPKENVLARGMGWSILWIGGLVGLLTVGVGYWAWLTGQSGWRTMAFTTLTLTQMGNVLALHTGRESFTSKAFFANKALLGSVLLTIVLQLAVVYIPFLQPIFETEPLSALQLGVTFLVSIALFFIIELGKLVSRRREAK